MTEPMTFRQQMHGFPLVPILVVSIIKLAEPIAFTSIFPYSFYMIRDFGIAKSQAEISTYAGYLASVFAFGQFISAVFWGKLADVYGRKIIITLGLIGSLLSLLAFGFAPNFWLAFMARGLMGLLNGNSGVSRSVISEIATDQRHRSLAFLSMAVTWNVGGVIGPLIGGKLSHPDTSVLGDSWFDELNKRYPYALPNIVIASILLSKTAIAYFFLKETHPEFRHRYDHGISVTERVLERIGWGSYDKEDFEDETASLLSRGSVLSPVLSRSLSRRESAGSLYRSISKTSEHDQDGQDHETGEEVPGPVSWTKILTPQVLNPIFSYFLMQAHFTANDEFIPIFVSYPPAYDGNGDLMSRFPIHLKGGLGYTPQKSGNLLSSSGFFGMFMITLVFPWIDKTFRKTHTFRFMLGVFPLFFIALPYVLLTLPKHYEGSMEDFTSPLSDLYIYVFIFARVMVAASMGTLVMVLINNNALPGYGGVINGASISAASFAAFMSPLMMGKLMSLGEQIGVAGLGWYGLAMITLIGFIQGCFIEVD